MAVRTDRTTDGSPHRKAVLFCRECGHESPLTGDWRTEEERGVVTYVCPSCGATVIEQSGARPIAC